MTKPRKIGDRVVNGQGRETLKPRFKVGDRVVTNRGREDRIRKIEVMFVYQTNRCGPYDCYGEGELRKLSVRRIAKAKQRSRRVQREMQPMREAMLANLYSALPDPNSTNGRTT